MTSSAFSPYALNVNGRKEMGSALQKTPSVARSEETPARLNVFVVFTSVQETLAALKEAGRLAAELGGQIILMELQVVPYPLPLSSPPVAIDWNERRLRLIAGESRVETIVHVYFCRDARHTLKNVLGFGSLVLVGGRKRWWPTRERRLARGLRQQGHEVILIETE